MPGPDRNSCLLLSGFMLYRFAFQRFYLSTSPFWATYHIAVRRYITLPQGNISHDRKVVYHCAACRARGPSKLNNDFLNSCLFLYTVVCTRISPYPHVLHRKEVIQPHLPIRLPCYDLTPITEPTFGHALLAVRLWTSGVFDFHGLTGGVYKARERIHRDMLIRDY